MNISAVANRMKWLRSLNFAAAWLWQRLERKPRVLGLGLGLALSMAVASCTPAVGKKDLLDFVQAGQTTREDVYFHLGNPSEEYGGSRIATYGIAEDEGGLSVSNPRLHAISQYLEKDWSGIRYSLVFAFDETGVLRRYSLVRIHDR
jgi:hypothetical protein